MNRLLSFKNDLVMKIGVVNQVVLKTVLINEMLNEYFLSVNSHKYRNRKVCLNL